jgi:hypothetical protein
VYKTLEEAMKAKQDFIERIQAIDVQLSERAAQMALRAADADYKAYLEWKARAVRSKATLTSKLSRAKTAIRNLRTAEMQQRLDSRDDAYGLLKELYKLTRTFVAEGVDISAEEQLLLDDVQQYLNNN